MAYSNGMITAPVNQYDVQLALGISSPDWSDLCSSTRVNKWAKYKPIKWAKKETLTAQNLIDGNYGIKDIPTWTRLSYASTFLFSDARGSLNDTYWPECDREKGALSLEYWTHNRPDGGSAGAYRITDFANYFHNAEEPIGPMTATSIVIGPTGTLRVSFSIGALSDYTLKLSDLTWPGSSDYPFGNMYFGVLMKQLTGLSAPTTCVATQNSDGTDITMSDAAQYGGYWVDFPSSFVADGFAGTWKMFPIISNIAIAATTSISQQDGNKFIAPLPFHNQTIIVGIEYAELLITSVNGYKDSTSHQRYARFVVLLKSPETTAGRVRNYSVKVTLCDSSGNELNGYSGGTATGQITTNATGTVTDTITVSAYIAQIWSSSIYYKVEVSITDTLRFKRTNYRALSGPIEEESL